MINPSPTSNSPCMSRPLGSHMRVRSRNPKAFTSQSSAATPSSYEIIGMTVGVSVDIRITLVRLAPPESLSQHRKQSRPFPMRRSMPTLLSVLNCDNAPHAIKSRRAPAITQGILISTSSFKVARTSGPPSPSDEASGGGERGSS